MWPKHDAKTDTHTVYVVPASQLGRAKSGPEVFQGPAGEAFDALLRFAVSGPLWDLFTIARS